MSYASAIEELKSMTPELYARPGQPRRKFSLDEVRILLSKLGDPQQSFPSVLIAGTNGKGSTAATLASILNASGLRAGLYTSPHLERVNERIRIGDAEIGDKSFARHFFHIKESAQKLVQSRALPQPPSFFEILTAEALLYFAEQNIDLAVLEVGLGGRLDATNVVDPLLSIITDISLDHTEWLGSTITAIAREKAGIMRPGGRLVTLPQHPDANLVLRERAGELNARVVDAEKYIPAPGPSGPYRIAVLGKSIEVHSPLPGAHQQRNVALAIAASVELAAKDGLPITASSIETGIRLTRWPGRLESIQAGGTEWILDVAHNPAGALALRTGLNYLLTSDRQKLLIFSCLQDKPLGEIAQILFPLFDQVILTPIRSLRAASMAELKEAAEETQTSSICTESVGAALQLAKELGEGGVVVVSGSVYLVGEARSLLLNGSIA